jgi:hypothetical protein
MFSYLPSSENAFGERKYDFSAGEQNQSAEKLERMDRMIRGTGSWVIIQLREGRE